MSSTPSGFYIQYDLFCTWKKVNSLIQESEMTRETHETIWRRRGTRWSSRHFPSFRTHPLRSLSRIPTSCSRGGGASEFLKSPEGWCWRMVSTARNTSLDPESGRWNGTGVMTKTWPQRRSQLRHGILASPQIPTAGCKERRANDCCFPWGNK